MAIRSKNKVNTSFNMSSMTDIVFLLLIFFIITSTLISPKGLDLILPQSSAQVLAAKQNVTISITKDLQFGINSEVVPFDALESKLMSLLKGVDTPGVILKAAQGVPIEEVVRVMDIASRNKLKMVLATSPK